jgi:hypothetical protein
VDEQRVGVAARRYRESLAGPDRHDVNAHAGCGPENRQDVVEQTGVLGRGGGTQCDEALAGVTGADGKD